MQSRKLYYALHDALQTKTKLIFYTRNEVGYGFFSCLSTECSYFVFKGIPIEFHAKLKNELFVQSHHT